MKLGQMSFKKVSTIADFLQLDICGLSKDESYDKYINYDVNIPVILHGDWTKNGHSENNIKERTSEYIQIIHNLLSIAEIHGLTIHPPFRKKVSFEDFINYCNLIETATGIPVFIENRSNNKIWLSYPGEIIEFSNKHYMTIDLPQLFISCGYEETAFLDTVLKINWSNVKELHLGNIKRNGKNTFVARKIEEGEIDLNKVISFIKGVDYCTFEILGGVNVFENQKSCFMALL
ncbi:MAG: hypothetical protein K0R54_164 [Clostridiaceae bacterium]|jgi:hypothetical protein|nr:hypothetical protein [Clostridiaceae bacterium]